MLALYMDHHVRTEVIVGLRIRGIDVLTAYEDQHHTVVDPVLLDRALSLGRILFTQDDDLLVEATKRQEQGIDFTGIIYAHQLNINIGMCVTDLELIAQTCSFDELANNVLFLPL